MQPNWFTSHCNLSQCGHGWSLKSRVWNICFVPSCSVFSASGELLLISTCPFICLLCSQCCFTFTVLCISSLFQYVLHSPQKDASNSNWGQILLCEFTSSFIIEESIRSCHGVDIYLEISTWDSVIFYYVYYHRSQDESPSWMEWCVCLVLWFQAQMPISFKFSLTNSCLVCFLYVIINCLAVRADDVIFIPSVCLLFISFPFDTSIGNWIRLASVTYARILSPSIAYYLLMSLFTIQHTFTLVWGTIFTSLRMATCSGSYSIQSSESDVCHMGLIPSLSELFFQFILYKPLNLYSSVISPRQTSFTLDLYIFLFDSIFNISRLWCQFPRMISILSFWMFCMV